LSLERPHSTHVINTELVSSLDGIEMTLLIKDKNFRDYNKVSIPVKVHRTPEENFF
jgi:hypothetical protein